MQIKPSRQRGGSIAQSMGRPKDGVIHAAPPKPLLRYLDHLDHFRDGIHDDAIHHPPSSRLPPCVVVKSCFFVPFITCSSSPASIRPSKAGQRFIMRLIPDTRKSARQPASQPVGQLARLPPPPSPRISPHSELPSKQKNNPNKESLHFHLEIIGRGEKKR